VTELPVLNRRYLWEYAEREGRPVGYERFCRMYGLEMEQRQKHTVVHLDKATIDFEGRSARDLTRCGAYIYANSITTQVLCLAYKINDGPTKLWHRAHPRAGIEQSPFPQDLADHIAAGRLVEAHSAGFELHVWNVAFRREFPEFPPLVLGQLTCSAAKASHYALPRALEKACEVMRLPIRKDMDGSKVMKRCSNVMPRHKQSDTWETKVALGLVEASDLPWHEDPADLRANWAYCMNDVDAEHCLSSRLRNMSEREMEFWRMDIRMNQRGIKCDEAAATAAIEMAEGAANELNGRLREITGGAVPKGSSRTKLKKWANEQGFLIQNTQADHIKEQLGLHKKELLLRPRGSMVIEAMEIAIDVNQTSTSKYKQMIEMIAPDGRLRDLMMYYGAMRTGRWSGKGVQPHNFLRGFSEDMEWCWEQILKAHREPDMFRLTILFGSAMKALAKATRGCLVADEGKDLMIADFAAIEARVLPWLAEDHATLEIFRSGQDIYLKMAGDVYEFSKVALDMEFMSYIHRLRKDPLNKALLKEIKAKFPVHRQLGKKGILGLGFQMGAEKFDDECADEDPPIDMPRSFFKEVVKTYRETSFPLISSFWSDIEEAAVNAINHKGKRFDCRMVAYKVVGDFLHCELPNRRLLSYHFPTISTSRTITWAAKSKQGKEATIRVRVPQTEGIPAAYKRAMINARFGEKTIPDPKDFEVSDKPTIFFSGMNQKTRQYERMTTYGGSLAENVTQATARDFMAEAMLRCDRDPLYDMMLSVHDELIAEVDEDKGDVKEFELMMSALPDWVKPDYECPIKAEGWRGKRYRK